MIDKNRGYVKATTTDKAKDYSPQWMYELPALGANVVIKQTFTNRSPYVANFNVLAIDLVKNFFQVYKTTSREKDIYNKSVTNIN
jgi:hypothetical protein